jgi:hypothetical protein
LSGAAEHKAGKQDGLDGVQQGKRAPAHLQARAGGGRARAQRGAPVGLSRGLCRHGLGLCQGKKGLLLYLNASVADPGSRIQICFHPGSLIINPGSNNHKFHKKIVNFLFFVVEHDLSQLTKNLNMCDPNEL